ncbi:MAG: sigma-70 family RNA polymerase sigma factor [Chloroflexota bacterium]|nr:sigma-70 family RNA polymerase sigma factor [Chloroflexota bacterium]
MPQPEREVVSRSEPQGDEETRLVQAACGDPAAFEALYQRYHARVYGYLRTRTTTDEDAADLLQHVFLRVLDALPHYQPQRGPFAAWLFVIARNMATDFHRRQGATVAWDLVPPGLRTPPGDTVEAQVLRREDDARLAMFIRKLPPLKREMLALRFVGQLTVPEIAAVIGKREDATRKLLARTLQTLKERYDDAAI